MGQELFQSVCPAVTSSPPTSCLNVYLQVVWFFFFFNDTAMAVVWRVRDKVEKEREENGLGDCTWENFTDTVSWGKLES